MKKMTMIAENWKAIEDVEENERWIKISWLRWVVTVHKTINHKNKPI